MGRDCGGCGKRGYSVRRERGECVALSVMERHVGRLHRPRDVVRGHRRGRCGRLREPFAHCGGRGDRLHPRGHGHHQRMDQLRTHQRLQHCDVRRVRASRTDREQQRCRAQDCERRGCLGRRDDTPERFVHDFRRSRQRHERMRFGGRARQRHPHDDGR